MKPVNQWSFIQKFIAFLVSSLTLLGIIGTVAVWAGDTRWQKIAEADIQAQRISDYVNIEQYSFRRDNLILDKVGKPIEVQEHLDAKIRILDNRINSLEKKRIR